MPLRSSMMAAPATLAASPTPRAAVRQVRALCVTAVGVPASPALTRRAKSGLTLATGSARSAAPITA